MSLIADLYRRQQVQQLSVFHLPELVGYSLATAALGDKQPKDSAYEAIWSAAKATTGLIAKEAPETVVLGWPVVILRGNLFQATLDEGCVVEVQEIDRGVLAWRNPVIAAHSFLTIVTEPALAARGASAEIAPAERGCALPA